MARLNEGGQILGDVLASLGILVVGALLIGLLAINASAFSQYSVEELQATFLAQEGLEAARSIRDKDFDDLTDGTHGLALSNNQWIFSGISDIQDRFTRQIIVSSVDARLKKIVSNVTGPETNVSLTTYLANLKQSAGAAGNLTFDLSGALLENGNKTLRNIKLTNNGGASVTIDKITVWWQGDSPIQEIRLNSAVWSHANTGSPSGKQPSGTELNIVDYTLGAGQSESDTWFKFEGPTSATNFIVRFQMSDGSVVYVRLEL